MRAEQPDCGEYGGGWPHPASAHEPAEQSVAVPGEKGLQRCDDHYGVGDGTTAICARPVGHPPVSADGIGHSPYDRGTQGCASLLHTYTEASARARLTRRRSEGEALSMFHCPWGDHWHTVTEAERADLFGRTTDA